MDLRPRMYAISLGQREVTNSDPRAEYVPTSHVGAEIGRPVGLHYHYGTLGQLQHGENYASAYLRTLGLKLDTPRPLNKWPYKKRQHGEALHSRRSPQYGRRTRFCAGIKNP